MDRRTTNHYQDIILDSINEGVFTVDRNWRITSFNRSAEKITGIRREDAIGRSCKEIFRADICENNCALKKTATTGEPVTNVKTHISRSTGEKVAIRISTALLKESDHRIVGGVETFQDLSQLEQLRKELEYRYTFADIIGQSNSMQSLFKILPQISESESTVLLEGASGTGKELFARAIHNLSKRKKNRFVALNCAALPDTLLESELFGYKAGAFTGARRDKIGRLAYARGGTVFLDEIGDISPALQIRLLRVLQERTIEPLGALEPVKINVRVIAATNKDLDDLVQKGLFRKDLYYRIRIVRLKLPRLAERRMDIPLLVHHIISKLNSIQDRMIEGVSDRVLSVLMKHDYPGNIRELENILEHAFVLCQGDLIELEHLPPELLPDDARLLDRGRHFSTLRDIEKFHITAILAKHGGNRGKAARELGINASTLYRKIKSLNIHPPLTDGRFRDGSLS